MPNEKGFSLIELLVSLAVIGVLAAIAIPEYKNYKGQVYNKVAQSAARNLAIAINSAAVDYEDVDGLREEADLRGLPNSMVKNQGETEWSSPELEELIFGAFPLADPDMTASISIFNAGSVSNGTKKSGVTIRVRHCKGAKSSTAAVIRDCEPGEPKLGGIPCHDKIDAPPQYQANVGTEVLFFEGSLSTSTCNS